MLGEYDAGYEGYIDTLIHEAEELQAENDKLRERVAELEELLPDSGRYFRAETVEAYVAEIAKLRKFAAVVWELLTKNEPTFVWQGLADEARELGVEVDE